MLNTGGTITLLAMGRLHPNKAFDTLLAALSLLPVNFRLILAGSGDEENALRQQASAGGISNRVEFCGWQDDTAPLWGRADIFVCPSRHEPLGNVMQEAMANRVPIVATATDGTTLLLKHERSALVVPVDDSKAMAAAIQRYPQEPLLAQQCVEAAFTLWQAKYSKAAVVQQYKTFLQEITS
jgi:glycosyltransferase involved in cell wall biosynthesis